MSEDKSRRHVEQGVPRDHEDAPQDLELTDEQTNEVSGGDAKPAAKTIEVNSYSWGMSQTGSL